MADAEEGYESEEEVVQDAEVCGLWTVWGVWKAVRACGSRL